MINRLKSRFRGDGMSAVLLRSGAGTVVLRIAGTLLAFLLSVALARTLGPDGYGMYAYVFALVGIPAQIGLSTLLLRDTARAEAAGDWPTMRGLWRWSSQASLAISGVLAAAGVVVYALTSGRWSPMETATAAIGLVLMPVLGQVNLMGAALRGLRRVVLGQLPDTVLRPGLFLVLVAAVPSLTSATAMALHTAATLAALLVTMLLVRAAAPWRGAAEPVAHSNAFAREWFHSSVPLAITAVLMLVNQQADILLLGVFRSKEEVGAYRVAVSMAGLVAVGLQAGNMVLSPHFARLYAQNDMRRLQILVTQSSRLVVWLALPVVLLCTFFGEPLLRLIFGPRYAGAYAPLAILCWGQLVNVAMGSVGVLLNMTGYERDTLRGVTVAAGINLVLNLVMIPLWGMHGAAISSGTSLAVWNLVLWRMVDVRLGIDTMAFTWRRARRQGKSGP